ncbi:MAG: SIS domain-containing protein [Erysipelotrichaceae bacterium]|nr:SIS domain-containing protein [Erysipelotrichaceae bacterium]
MIISNSGRNSVPVEVALEFKAKGAQVIAITSMRPSTQVSSRQKDGKKLYEVADLVLDNQAVFGDVAYTPEGYDKPVAGTSNFIGIAIVQCILKC